MIGMFFFNRVMGMHESFKDADDREDTNDSSIGTPGDLTDGRATLVPPSGFTHLQVTNGSLDKSPLKQHHRYVASLREEA